MLKCSSCGRRLDRPSLEAVQQIASQFPGFQAGQLCCRCFDMASNLYTIITNQSVVVTLKTPSAGDGSHHSWWTTVPNLVVRGIPKEGKPDYRGFLPLRGRKVLARLVYASPKIIILRFLRWVQPSEELEAIGSLIWKVKKK